MEPWRRMRKEDQRDFLRDVVVKLDRRLKAGAEEYESEKYGFVGDPLTHLEHELLDGLAYIHYLRRKVVELEEENDKQKKEIQYLKERKW